MSASSPRGSKLGGTWVRLRSGPGRRRGGWTGRRAVARRTSLGLFEDLHDPPPLGGGQRTGLHHQNPVADSARVLLVVHLQLPRTADDLAVQRVLDAVLDLDHDGLVHLVADHQALADLPSVALAHAVTSSGATESPSSRSRMIV